MTLQLSPTDFAKLRDGTGQRFMEFVDRLIRAEAALGGLPHSEVQTQLRSNIPDGGVDASVARPLIQDPSGWFQDPTCWQYKGMDAAGVTDKALQKEIKKPHCRKLIKDGYAYRLCILGDLTPQKVTDWESLLAGEARQINPSAPLPRVVHGGFLLGWAERFPAIVAWLRDTRQLVLHWEAWAENCTAVTRVYVENPAWINIRDQIVTHTSLDRPPVGGDPCLTIEGAAGVGKTRLVFESLRRIPASPSLVLYSPDEQETRAVATAVTNTLGQSLILVADECSSAVQQFLNNTLRGHVDRIRAICIDNAGRRLASGAAQIWLTPESSQPTEEILEKNYSHVPPDRRHRYADLSEGFVRLAADMCDHDAELSTGDMSRLLTDAERYVLHRLRDDHLPLISALALFNKIGFKEDVQHELDALCTITGKDARHFRAAVRDVKESPGFVVQAGRYWYISPHIVARVLFAHGWRQWVSDDLNGFLEQLNESLLQQVVDRVALHGGEEVREQLAGFFRKWFAELTAERLADADHTLRAAAIIEAVPHQYLPKLRHVIEAAAPGELARIRGHAYGHKWGPRRTLVWLLEKLVSFPQFFRDSEACLFRLALEESEENLGNNATRIWESLFAVHLSGTATPFEERFAILQARWNAAQGASLQLVSSAVSQILESPSGKVLGPPVIAGQLRPPDWQPSSWQEQRDCYREIVQFALQQLQAGSRERRSLGFGLLTERLSFILDQGLLDELQTRVPQENLSDEETRSLIHAIDDVIEHLVIVGREDDQLLQQLSAWSTRLRPSDFGGRLRTICSRDPWDRYSLDSQGEGQREIDALAQEALDQMPALRSHLDWLVSAEARSAERFSFALGRLDSDDLCGDMILEHAVRSKAMPVARGYVRGMLSVTRQPSQSLLQLVDQLEKEHPEGAADLLSYAGDPFDGFHRIMRLVDDRKVSPRLLVGLAMGIGTRELSSIEIQEVLQRFVFEVDEADQDLTWAAVRFLSLCVARRTRKQSELLTSEALRGAVLRVLEDSVTRVDGRVGSEWIHVVEAVALFELNRASDLLGRALLSDSHTLYREAERLLSKLAESSPNRVMEAFGASLLNPTHGWKLQVHVCRDVVEALPAEIVAAWVRRHGKEGAKAIARHLPAPYVTDSGEFYVPEVLDILLREFGDEDVFNSFLAGVHSGEVWWGSAAAKFRETAAAASRFAHHPNPWIRKWAMAESEYRNRLADLEEQSEEERFLP